MKLAEMTTSVDLGKTVDHPSNCGAAGWVTDRAGYRYDHRDPESGRRWPAMPDEFGALHVTPVVTAEALTAGVEQRYRADPKLRGRLRNSRNHAK